MAKAQNVEERFWRFVMPEPNMGCWLWVGHRQRGYGMFSIRSYPIQAHRFAYEQWRGPIPDGLTIDHLCRMPSCVNPWHLEAVTIQVNLARGNGAPARNARKTRCKRDHELAGINLGVAKDGRRFCRTCDAYTAHLRYRRYNPVVMKQNRRSKWPMEDING